MSISSNVGRSRSDKPCSFAKCNRQMKYRCGEISVAAASGLLLGRSCSTCDRRNDDPASSFSCWAKCKLNVVLLKIVLPQTRTQEWPVWLVFLAHYLTKKTESWIYKILLRYCDYFLLPREIISYGAHHALMNIEAHMAHVLSLSIKLPFWLIIVSNPQGQ